jgi:hypothetical protein
MLGALMALGVIGSANADTSMLVASVALSASAADPCIVREGESIRITAGVLERVMRVSGGNVSTGKLTVSGAPLVDGRANELSFRIARAEPNRNPLELPLDSGAAAVSVQEAKANDTDALDISGKAEPETKHTAGQLQWTDERSFSAGSWGACFDLLNATITTPQPGTQRLVIRARPLKDPLLAGLSVNLIYEVYAGFPVIRKWVEIHNNSANWLRLDNLLTDDIRLGNGFGRGLPLTPSERGATASIIAYSQADSTRGVIVASEVPSALRLISEHGASGYNPEHYEWVLGPAESFVAEPTFLYGFSGEVVRTASAESFPLDRAVEGGFKDFLREHLGISPAHTQLPAPLWCSWSNFGPVLTDAIVREQADLAARCGFVTMVLDDGWQKDRLGTRPNEKTFPQFGETCDYIRSKGLRLGLWVSCFRAPDADDFKALPAAAAAPEVRRLDGVAMSFASSWNRYFANDLAFLHDRYGATYFKQDFTNIKFGDLAAGHLSRTRKESLLRGLRGLLESQTTLRHLAPDVANNISHEIYWGTPGTPCDLAALKSVSHFHIPPNDYSGCGHFKERPGPAWSKYDPDTLRAQLVKGCMNARTRLYAHRGLPLECAEYYGAATVNWRGSLTPQVQDRQVCSWLMGAPTVYAGDLASLSDENIARYRSRFDILKRLEATYGIYRRFQYSGVPAPTDSDWHWWGKLDARGCGAVVVLRGSGGNERRAINIPWAVPDATYQVTSLLVPGEWGVFTGKQLQDGGLTLPLPPLGQEILELAPTAENN